MKLPACDLIPRVSKFCFEERQDIWNCWSGNKLLLIYSVLGTARRTKIISHVRRWLLTNFDFAIVARLIPTSESCRLQLTVEHIIITVDYRTIPTCKTFDWSTLPFRLWKTNLSVSTIAKTSVILSKKLIFIINRSFSCLFYLYLL